MAFVAPNSEIVICSGVEFDKGYKNTLTWNTSTEQEAYIETKKKFVLKNYTYLRNSHSIKVGLTVEQLIDCNYIAYKNTSYENKWFYAFITEPPHYVNNGTTEIVIAEDVLQTWYFDMAFNPCMIARQHVSDDTIGANLVNEDLETGDYTIAKGVKVEDLEIMPMIIGGVGLHRDSGNGQITVDKITYDNWFSVPGYIFEGVLCTICSSQTVCAQFLSAIQTAGYENAVLQITGIPRSYTTGLQIDTSISAGTVVQKTITISTVANWFQGYRPKNNKLYAFPYRFYLLSNTQGQTYKIKPEFLNDPNNVKVQSMYSIEPNPTMTLMMMDYKGVGLDVEDTLLIPNFPVSAYSNDTYKTWWAQNSVLYAQEKKEKITNTVFSGISTATNAVGTLAKIAAAPETGATLSDVKQVANSAIGLVGGLVDVQNLTERQLAQKKAAEINSVNVNYTNSSTALWSTRYMGFYMFCYCIGGGFAQRIDNYFSMYGYRVNRVLIPDYNNRRAWNYIKTIGCDCKPTIPQYAVEAINAIFDNGITFWHTPYKVGNYNQDNSIIKR